MLALPVVQVWAGVALAATAAGIGIALVRRPRAKGPIEVVARKNPAKGTQVVWLIGTFLAIFWPVGVFVLPEYAYHWPAIPDFPSSWLLQIVGVVLGASGGILFSRAARALGLEMTPIIQVRQGHELMQTGPYRFIRHPVYTAIVVISLGQTLLFLSLPLAGLTLVLLGLAMYRARLEESLLSASPVLGATYASYMARTGRFLPRMISRR